MPILVLLIIAIIVVPVVIIVKKPKSSGKKATTGSEHTGTLHIGDAFTENSTEPTVATVDSHVIATLFANHTQFEGWCCEYCEAENNTHEQECCVCGYPKRGGK